jgi:hypothetical protein
MLEVGVKMTNCGTSHDEICPGLSAAETQTHMAAWCIVSAPLTLSMDMTDKAAVDAAWPLISNKEALDVNDDWAGFSGSLFKESTELASFSTCHWGPDAPASECMFPAEQYWYKPLSGRDARQSVMAVLLMNNGPTPRNLSFTFNEVPGLRSQAGTAFSIFDVWEQKSIVTSQYGSYQSTAVPSHGSVFLKLSNGP